MWEVVKTTNKNIFELDPDEAGSSTKALAIVNSFAALGNSRKETRNSFWLTWAAAPPKPAARRKSKTLCVFALKNTEARRIVMPHWFREG